jgi:hypothetical protein
MSNSKYNNNEIGKVTFEQNYFKTKEAYPTIISQEISQFVSITKTSLPSINRFPQATTQDEMVATASFSKKVITIDRSDELILSSISVEVYLTSEGGLSDTNLSNEKIVALPYNSVNDLDLGVVPSPQKLNAFTYSSKVANDFALELFKSKVFFDILETEENFVVTIYYMSQISFVYNYLILGNNQEGSLEETIIPKITQINQNIVSMQRTFEKDVVTITNPTVAKGKTDFTLSSNELMQDKTYYDVEINHIGNFLSTRILKDFSKGKQGATILCSIDDYYDENGNLVICAKSNPTISKPMTFRMGDKVIPYIYTKTGKDVAMSKKPNNSDMVFKVIGIRIYQRGVVMQELELVEI